MAMVSGASELPELGPYLGRLADATRQFVPADAGLDPIRLDLVSDLFERAAAARGFLLTGDESGARGSLDRKAWLELWWVAANRAADATVAAATARLDDAARRVGFPPRKLAALVPGAEARAVLGARFEAAGIPLEEQVARGFGAETSWWDGVRQAAVAIEDSWEALEREVRRELAAVDLEVRRIEGWRPSLAGWYVALGLAVVATGWLGLVIGGYLPRPGPLEPLVTWFWSLPWP